MSKHRAFQIGLDRPDHLPGEGDRLHLDNSRQINECPGLRNCGRAVNKLDRAPHRNPGLRPRVSFLSYLITNLGSYRIFIGHGRSQKVFSRSSHPQTAWPRSCPAPWDIPPNAADTKNTINENILNVYTIIRISVKVSPATHLKSCCHALHTGP